MQVDIAILGIFVADATFRSTRMPKPGETLLGSGFALGPGGKGSNQAVAAAKAGGNTGFLVRLGADTFADMAEAIWAEAGVHPLVIRDAQTPTGAAFIWVDEATGQNAIIVTPGAAGEITKADIDFHLPTITRAKLFVTQLEQPIDVAHHALAQARMAGVTTVLNPAPAADLPEGMMGLCDWVTPNETEAEMLTGISVQNLEGAEAAALALVAQGAGAALITLGENGSYLYQNGQGQHIPPMRAGDVVETTGAGDAFNGGFVTALAEGQSPEQAARFATATAALSVTKPGTAGSMPARGEIERLLRGVKGAGSRGCDSVRQFYR